MKLLDIHAYLTYYSAEEYRTYLQSLLTSAKSQAALRVGMLKWANSDAHHLGGPFPGNFAFSYVKDRTGTELVKANDAFYAKHNARLVGTGRAPLTIEDPTTEKPVVLYMCGNDDTSYSAFFKTVKEAIQCLRQLEGAPVTYAQIKSLGFVFTN